LLSRSFIRWSCRTKAAHAFDDSRSSITANSGLDRRHERVAANNSFVAATEEYGGPVSKYVRIADRQAAEAKNRLRSGLQAISDDPKSTNDQKLGALSKLGDLHIAEERAESKAGPLRDEIEAQAKRLREIKAELDAADARATEAQARIAELEQQNGDLTTERNNLTSDLSRIGGALSDCRKAVDDAKKETRHAQKALAEANDKAEKQAFNLSTLIPLFKRHYAITEFADALVVDLFFVLGDRALADPFVAMGWTEEKVIFWQSWYQRAHNLPTERIITLLHRSACSCTQHEKETTIRDEGGIRPLTNDDRNFLHSLLRSRGIDTDLEIDKLIVTHREEWMRQNRSNLQFTPPLSHREITPLSRVVRWNED
jgi:hypothetical protein